MTPVDRRKDRPVREPVAARTATDAARTSTGVAQASSAVAQTSSGTEQTSVGTERVAASGAGRTPPDGVSRHAQRTLDCLHDSGARGATTEDLSEAVGFTARTVAKHLDGLSRCGLVEQRGDGRWSATDPGPGTATGSGSGTAPREASLPAQQGRAGQPADRRAAAVRPEEMQAALPTLS
ncbi:winged helix-turn-helix domain-containing protein [Streptomyces sp. NPDC021093]|uniref:winged helix-turn-helix domain-containing protein n=1 Tax=Streptomyces sp. NPDC021093 TaxID=3365112 RepID=UPI0037AF34FD